MQTFETIAPYTIEEAYEVADAIGRRDLAGLPDELGDLLLQVVYHARMAEEAGLFGFAEVARAIADKMIRRHPALFPAAGPADWETQKTAERRARAEHGTLDGIARGLPALTRALKVTVRAGRVGFDWPDAGHVLAKLEEEIAEVRAEIEAASPARLADEVGDVLFVAANLARKLGLDPEACLHQATDKFTRAVRRGGAAAGRRRPGAGGCVAGADGSGVGGGQGGGARQRLSRSVNPPPTPPFPGRGDVRTRRRAARTSWCGPGRRSGRLQCR